MFRVQVLGTASAVPTYFRNLSAQVVTYHDRNYLIDCGEGTQMQFLRHKIRTQRLDAIFISHLHGDHIFGLPGLLCSMSMDTREKTLPIYAPGEYFPLLKSILSQTKSHLSFELECIPTNDFEVGKAIFSTDSLEVSLLPLKHRIFCRGFFFKEINKKPKFNFYKAKALEIPNVFFTLLKLGNSVTLEDGRTIQPEDVLELSDPALSYAYCSDTAYNEALLPFLEKVDLLYHEATFEENLRARAKETGHSTAKDAATIALKAEAKRLLLGHFSARYTDLQPILEEALSLFPNTILAEDGKIYPIKG